MAKKRTASRLKSGFNLGGEQAEADPLLSEAFYKSGYYSAVESPLDRHSYLVARTGGGKSASLSQLERDHPQHVIRITPENLSLPYITDLRVFRYLDSLDVHLDLLFIALWKHVLLVEIIRHRYNVDSPDAKARFLAGLIEKVNRDPAKRQALEYLEDFEGKFWCEADERVRDITERFEKEVELEAGGSLSLSGVAGIGFDGSQKRTHTKETRAEEADRFQRIVNKTQLARLNTMVGVLDEDILDSPQHFTYVVIDDLDRDWVDERLANDLIYCLFRSVLDLVHVANLKVLVALRTNIFQQLHFEDRRGSQEEKFRALVLDMRWTRQELVEMLDERAKAAAKLWGQEDITGVRRLLPAKNRSRGDPVDYLLDRTLLRPRDAIAFVNECLLVGSGKGRVSWTDIHAAEHPYSEKRLLALRDEWNLTYPGMQSVLAVFRGSSDSLSRDEIQTLLDDIMLLPAEPTFAGVRWVTDLSEPMWSAGAGDRDWNEVYQPLVKVLFDIGFLGLASKGKRKAIYAHDEPGFASRRSELTEEMTFHVHPAFHKGLEIAEARPSRGEGGTSD